MSHGPRDRESALCLSCGLCCSGALHHHVRLRPEEVERAATWPVTTSLDDGRHHMDLPCGCLDGSRCTVYGERPAACRTFACRLLLRYRAGEIDEAEAQGIIDATTHAFARMREALVPMRRAGLWRRRDDDAERTTDGDDPAIAGIAPEIRLAAGAAGLLLGRHFVARAERGPPLG